MQVAKTSTEPDQDRDRRWLGRLWPSRYTRPHRPRPSGKRDSAVAKGQDPLEVELHYQRILSLSGQRHARCDPPGYRFCWWFYWLQAYHSTGGAFLHTCSCHNIGSLIHTMAIANTARDFVATDRRIGQGAFIEVVGQHDLNATAISRCRIVPVGCRTGRRGLQVNLAQGELYRN